MLGWPVEGEEVTQLWCLFCGEERWELVSCREWISNLSSKFTVLLCRKVFRARGGKESNTSIQGVLGVRFVGLDYGFWENIWTCSTDKRQETGDWLTGFSWQQEGTEREQIITDRSMEKSTIQEVKTIWQRCAAHAHLMWGCCPSVRRRIEVFDSALRQTCTPEEKVKSSFNSPEYDTITRHHAWQLYSSKHIFSNIWNSL